MLSQIVTPEPKAVDAFIHSWELLGSQTHPESFHSPTQTCEKVQLASIVTVEHTRHRVGDSSVGWEVSPSRQFKLTEVMD